MSVLQASGWVVAAAAAGFVAFIKYHRSNGLIRGDLPYIPEEDIPGGRLNGMLQCLLKYGGPEGIVRLHVMPGRTIVLVTSPDLIKEIMVSNRAEWQIADREALRAITGNGLLVIKGEYWRFQRELINPAFHYHNLEPMSSTFNSCADVLLERLRTAARTGAEVDIHEYLMQLTLDVIGRTAFGQDFRAQTDSPTAVAVSMQSFLSKAGKPGQLPNKKQQEHLDVVRNSLRSIIQDRITAVRGSDVTAANAAPKDLLTMLCAAKDPATATQMSLEQIMAEVMTFLLAGHDTTANLMSWFVAVMSEYKTCYAAVRDELDAVFGDSGVDAGKISQCHVLDSTIKETLRYHSPVPMLGRVPARDGVVLGGKYRVPAGTLVLTAPWLVHHDPRLWKDPETFDPHRFDDSPHGNSASPFSFIPFSCGPRRCIGSNFAMLESHLILARMFYDFTFQVTDAVVKARVGVVRRPKGGLHVKVTARR